ncbi:flagellar hook-basal body complex protein [Moorella sulfitireducens (nom. illeg.)]|uniref:flagellar hook-basal body complex protein n=1 Tax=Neomoorella sulfitireducens TaxID=2972948 RepID=UPI0021AC16F3|nr:flagellar hook-basal body complex protein [Moorella sulfitireducens]
MMRSLFSAVSGLRTHQLRMDVIGDNIANVNTVGFKRSAVTFKDVFYQTLRGGAAGSNDIGGTNPQQIGLGVTLNSIDVIHTQGAAASTNNGTDLMIQGDGFFEVKDVGGNVYYTRAGNFHFDSEGNLVTPDGLIVQDSGGNGINIGTSATSYSIDKYGNVYVDGTQSFQIKLVKFPNPPGLEKIGSNLYAAAAGAGTAIEGVAGDTNFPNTTIIPSALEMSNVELALEFTEMIITERGFQANARTITVSDEMLQELVNLKR